MNKNLYGLMNWPEIEGIVYAECDKPKELLGAHVTGKGLLIQIMRPDAVAVKLHIDGRKTAVNMEKVDESGFFAALVSSKKKLSYTYSVEKVKWRDHRIYGPICICKCYETGRLQSISCRRREKCSTYIRRS